ncbi:nucleotidyltransferase [Actinoplanes sp. NBRC 101535]|uniref:nucleotidyltransferase domain-containing protein n=1 Tax=Actinoplanes sp. NBRC 101535 TaxID=3032196 RepID=UPI0024A49142|nr:nucleotidyltransferase [Actinoplanes sp. NBRC 101535]GLY06689.1 nucleotidyltransferase [Actinoplanes sp. NBRC 101535]
MTMALRSPEFWLPWAEKELRDALGRSTLLDTRRYEIFVQGSRANGTALDDTSDIDLVLMLTGPHDPGYGWEEFRDDVLTTMGKSYRVRMGRRCLNVDEPDSLFGEMVDVLVATEHRGGVFFRDKNGLPIVNFPKQHRRNGDAKDLRTGGRFKQAVRAAKRARVENGVPAPSYLLECLLYNVPDNVFDLVSYRSALGWLREHRDELDGLYCQNGINRLFGPGPDQWDADQVARIIDVLHQI